MQLVPGQKGLLIRDETVSVCVWGGVLAMHWLLVSSLLLVPLLTHHWHTDQGGRIGVGLGGGHAQQHGKQVQHPHLLCPLRQCHPHQRRLPPTRWVWRHAGWEPQQEKRQAPQSEHGSPGFPGNQERQHRWEDVAKSHRSESERLNFYYDISKSQVENTHTHRP